MSRKTRDFGIIRNPAFLLLINNKDIALCNSFRKGFHQSCRRHVILTTPHQRNEVERSVGPADAASVPASRWARNNLDIFQRHYTFFESFDNLIHAASISTES